MTIYKFVGTTDVFYDRGYQKGNEKLKSLKNLKIQFKGWPHLNHFFTYRCEKGTRNLAFQA